MKQKLLTDIELDVHELKLLMNTFSKEPTQTLSELLKRSILRMQERLEQLSEEISAVPVEASPSPGYFFTSYVKPMPSHSFLRRSSSQRTPSRKTSNKKATQKIEWLSSDFRFCGS